MYNFLNLWVSNYETVKCAIGDHSIHTHLDVQEAQDDPDAPDQEVVSMLNDILEIENDEIINLEIDDEISSLTTEDDLLNYILDEQE